MLEHPPQASIARLGLWRRTCRALLGLIYPNWPNLSPGSALRDPHAAAGARRGSQRVPSVGPAGGGYRATLTSAWLANGEAVASTQFS